MYNEKNIIISINDAYVSLVFRVIYIEALQKRTH